MRDDPERGARLLHATTRSGPKRGYYYQLAATTGWSSLPFLPLLRSRRWCSAATTTRSCRWSTPDDRPAGAATRGCTSTAAGTWAS